MANAEEINMFDFKATEQIADSIKRLTDAGIAPPAEVVSIVLRSGSQLDIACQEIRVSDWGAIGDTQPTTPPLRSRK